MDPVAFDGVLVIDKPAGPTSHDIVACVRRTLSLKKVGHLGTLDPLATGVLPLVVGRATRLASLLAGASKQYDAVIRLGLITDTYDITGTVVGGADAPRPDATSAEIDGLQPSPETIAHAAAGFVGSYPQRPPPFSAKKIDGVRAYDLARRRQPVEVTPAQVTVEALTVLSIDGPRVRCRVVCSSGFYIRSLAHDLGDALGCGGCLETLRRERHGPFNLQAAVPLAQIVEKSAWVATQFVPMGSLLPSIPAVVVSDQGARRAAHGNPLRVADMVPAAGLPLPNAGRVRVLDERGRLLAVADRRGDGTLRPKIVLV
ncbi:MAG: tRNA pseudouridine(55) synthase TruB [Vicinamibacterales bacterium]|nr:tRNA pseudouridine(55) synthase TruB [Vicinamibacterales bacterium]RUA00416.1 MAG: tRNA pseudouridine(55) synthase TruB [Candidatus Neomarinimicrobiota bacterium]